FIQQFLNYPANLRLRDFYGNDLFNIKFKGVIKFIGYRSEGSDIVTVHVDLESMAKEFTSLTVAKDRKNDNHFEITVGIGEKNYVMEKVRANLLVELLKWVMLKGQYYRIIFIDNMEY